MRVLRLLTGVIGILSGGVGPGTRSYAPVSQRELLAGSASCIVTARIMPAPRPIDSLLSVRGALVALVGSGRSTTRFLPHDNLLVLRNDQLHTIALPAYTTPPGLVAGSGGLVDVIVDNSVLLVDTVRERVVARRRLDIVALGWPAAAAVFRDRLYVGGEVGGAFPSAAAEALRITAARAVRVLWRRKLGYTHAGLWLAPAGRDLIVYVPNAYDAGGSMAVLDLKSGALRHAYPVPGPPLAADARHHYLYLAVGGTVQAREIDRGTQVGTASGSSPLVSDPAHRLVIFNREGRVVIADTHLRALTSIPMQGAQALAVGQNGSNLVVGLRRTLVFLSLRHCDGN